MTRKSIYDGLNVRGRVLFALGAFAYDEETCRGEKPLTADAADKLKDFALQSLVFFIMELKAADSKETAAKDEVTLNSCVEVLQHRREQQVCCDPELTPSFHGKDCLGNGEHEGIECCCEECDFYLACFPDWEEQMGRGYPPL